MPDDPGKKTEMLETELQKLLRDLKDLTSLCGRQQLQIDRQRQSFEVLRAQYLKLQEKLKESPDETEAS